MHSRFNRNFWFNNFHAKWADIILRKFHFECEIESRAPYSDLNYRPIHNLDVLNVE